MKNLSRKILLGLSLCLAFLTHPAFASDYPSKPIRILPTDFVAKATPERSTLLLGSIGPWWQCSPVA